MPPPRSLPGGLRLAGIGRGQPAAYVKMTDPFLNLLSSVSLRSSPAVSTPSNSRCPDPATTGMIQNRNSSMRPARTSVSSKRLVPYLMRSLPGCAFSRAIALGGSVGQLAHRQLGGLGVEPGPPLG